MLITRLVEHAATRDLPPPFYGVRTVRWAILLDSSGRCSSGRLEDLADASLPHGPQMPVPAVYRSGRTPPPMLIADTLQYIIGLPKDSTAKAGQDAFRRNEDYAALLAAWREAFQDDPAANVVAAFFACGGHRDIDIPKTASPGDYASIQVSGEWAHLTPSATAFWAHSVRARKTAASAGTVVCLACGQPGEMLGSIPTPVKAGAIPAEAGRAQPAQLVSVNTPAQGRAGKLQLAATPICETCGRQSIAALNALLADDRHHRRGNDSVLTWWLRSSEPVPFMSLLDHPDPGQVGELRESVHRTRSAAILAKVDQDKFFALVLGVTHSRVVVRDWIDIPVLQLKANLSTWFDDHRIAGLWHDTPQLVPLWRLAQASGRWDERTGRYVPGSAYHGAERDLLRCALQASPPPASLLPHLLHRIRADSHLDLDRSALLRLILARPPYREAIMTTLDTESADAAYVWGRIFAVLESIQRRALPDVSTTIRDRYFRIAMTQPLTIYPTLRAGANAHLSKLRRGKENARRAGMALEARLADLTALLCQELPGQLDAPGQARFAIGYDHQRSADMAAARAARSQPASVNS